MAACLVQALFFMGLPVGSIQASETSHTYLQQQTWGGHRGVRRLLELVRAARTIDEHYLKTGRFLIIDDFRASETPDGLMIQADGVTGTTWLINNVRTDAAIRLWTDGPGHDRFLHEVSEPEWPDARARLRGKMRVMDWVSDIENQRSSGDGLEIFGESSRLRAKQVATDLRTLKRLLRQNRSQDTLDVLDLFATKALIGYLRVILQSAFDLESHHSNVTDKIVSYHKAIAAPAKSALEVLGGKDSMNVFSNDLLANKMLRIFRRGHEFRKVFPTNLEDPLMESLPLQDLLFSIDLHTTAAAVMYDNVVAFHNGADEPSEYSSSTFAYHHLDKIVQQALAGMVIRSLDTNHLLPDSIVGHPKLETRMLFIDKNRLFLFILEVIKNALSASKKMQKPVLVDVYTRGPSRNPTHAVVEIANHGEILDIDELKHMFMYRYTNKDKNHPRIPREGSGVGGPYMAMFSFINGGSLEIISGNTVARWQEGSIDVSESVSHWPGVNVRLILPIEDALLSVERDTQAGDGVLANTSFSRQATLEMLRKDDVLAVVYANLSRVEQTRFLVHLEALAAGHKVWEGFRWVPQDYGWPYIMAQRFRSLAHQSQSGSNRIIYDVRGDGLEGDGIRHIGGSVPVILPDESGRYGEMIMGYPLSSYVNPDSGPATLLLRGSTAEELRDDFMRLYPRFGGYASIQMVRRGSVWIAVVGENMQVGRQENVTVTSGGQQLRIFPEIGYYLFRDYGAVLDLSRQWTPTLTALLSEVRHESPGLARALDDDEISIFHNGRHIQNLEAALRLEKGDEIDILPPVIESPQPGSGSVSPRLIVIRPGQEVDPSILDGPPAYPDLEPEQQALVDSMHGDPQAREVLARHLLDRYAKYSLKKGFEGKPVAVVKLVGLGYDQAMATIWVNRVRKLPPLRDRFDILQLEEAFTSFKIGSDSAKSSVGLAGGDISSTVRTLAESAAQAYEKAMASRNEGDVEHARAVIAAADRQIGDLWIAEERLAEVRRQTSHQQAELRVRRPDLFRDGDGILVSSDNVALTVQLEVAQRTLSSDLELARFILEQAGWEDEIAVVGVGDGVVTFLQRHFASRGDLEPLILGAAIDPGQTTLWQSLKDLGWNLITKAQAFRDGHVSVRRFEQALKQALKGRTLTYVISGENDATDPSEPSRSLSIRDIEQGLEHARTVIRNATSITEEVLGYALYVLVWA